MSESSRTALRDALRERYDDLVSRLTWLTGSRERARDAVHDTAVRLEQASVADEIKQPYSYLLRSAANAAANAWDRDQKFLSLEEVREIVEEESDHTQNLEASAELLSDMALIRRAMAALPERRRAILVAAYLEETPTDVLAERFGLSRRSIQYEVQQAIRDIRKIIAGPNIIPLRGRGRKLSKD